jgi:hypothetical protein
MGRLVEPWSAGSAGSAGSAAEAAGRDLRAPWSEPARAYHDLQHLTEFLAYVDTLAPGTCPTTSSPQPGWPPGSTTPSMTAGPKTRAQRGARRADARRATVRSEYAQYGDAAFRLGRAAVLRDLLALQSLFRTPRDVPSTRLHETTTWGLTHSTRMRPPSSPTQSGSAWPRSPR